MASGKDYWKTPTQKELPKKTTEEGPTDLGDNEAAPTEGVGTGGSGHPNAPSETGDSSSLGADSRVGRGGAGAGGTEAELIHGDDALDDLAVTDRTDPNLGLTNIGLIGPDDWAADIGPSRTAEEGTEGVSISQVADSDPLAEDKPDPGEDPEVDRFDRRRRRRRDEE